MNRTILFALLLATTLANAAAAASFSIEGMGGGSRALGSDLELRQLGYEPTTIDAQWSTHSLTPPLYWAMRFGLGGSERFWALELMHQKLFLDNLSPTVESFSISHGMNFVTVQHWWIHEHVRLMLGVGVLVAHPENTIRGETLPGDEGAGGHGYYVTGPALELGVGKRIPLVGDLFLNLESRATSARVRVPISHGEAATSSFLVHFLIGLGYQAD